MTSVSRTPHGRIFEISNRLGAAHCKFIMRLAPQFLSSQGWDFSSKTTTVSSAASCLSGKSSNGVCLEVGQFQQLFVLLFLHLKTRPSAFVQNLQRRLKHAFVKIGKRQASPNRFNTSSLLSPKHWWNGLDAWPTAHNRRQRAGW